MRAMTVEPGRNDRAGVSQLDGPVGEGDVLAQGLAVGICGTDREIAAGLYGESPPGTDRLVIGHESLGRVLEAPSGSALVEGGLVVGIVRRPDPVPCQACAVDRWDMCLNGRYTERGILRRDGYGAERWRVEADFAVPVPDALDHVAVLVEPASVVAKAWEQIDHLLGRSPVTASTVLVTGAGPIGLLAALLAVQREMDVHVLDRVVDGPKPDLVSDLGATYHHGPLDEVPTPDVVLECTGAPGVVVDAIGLTAPAGVTCLAGVSSGARTLELDVAAANRRIVLENDVVIGSVNASREHYRAAVDALAGADRGWLERIITRRVPLGSWPDGLVGEDDDVKVVVDLTA